MNDQHTGKISFLFKKPAVLRNRKRLKSFILQLFKENNLEVDMLHYTFCDDEEILKVNQDYLDHDYYTDIITFDLRERPTEPVNAEIFISLDTVRSNALEQKEGFQHELLRVIFHGALHLAGFDDKTDSDKIQMRQKEDFCLHQYAEF